LSFAKKICPLRHYIQYQTPEQTGQRADCIERSITSAALQTLPNTATKYCRSPEQALLKQSAYTVFTNMLV
jgi:hypothetical protein